MLNQTKFGLLMSFFDWFGTKRNSVSVPNLSGKKVITIEICFDLARLRKDLPCDVLCLTKYTMLPLSYKCYSFKYMCVYCYDQIGTFLLQLLTISAGKWVSRRENCVNFIDCFKNKKIDCFKKMFKNVWKYLKMFENVYKYF